MLCEAYKVGWDFVIAQQQQQKWQPNPNLAASHTGEDPSCMAVNIIWVTISGLPDIWKNSVHASPFAWNQARRENSNEPTIFLLSIF